MVRTFLILWTVFLLTVAAAAQESPPAKAAPAGQVASPSAERGEEGAAQDEAPPQTAAGDASAPAAASAANPVAASPAQDGATSGDGVAPSEPREPRFLVVPPTGSPLAPGERMNFQMKEQPLGEALIEIASYAGANLLMPEGLVKSMTIELRGVTPLTAVKVVCERAGLILRVRTPGVWEVRVPPRVTYAIEGAEIADVLTAIGRLAKANLVIGPEVQGTVRSLLLEDLPWREAVEVVASSLGYAVYEDLPGVYRVGAAPPPPPEPQEPEPVLPPLVTRVFQLQYLRPRSVYMATINTNYALSPFSQSGAGGGGGGGAGGGSSTLGSGKNAEYKRIDAMEAVEHALTGRGKVDFLPQENVLVVTDEQDAIERVQLIVERLDKEPFQIFVDVKFVTTTNLDIFDLGVDYPDTGVAASLSLGAIPTRLPFNLGNGGFEDSIIANDSGKGPFAGPFTANTPAQNTNAGTTIVPNTVFGALDFTQVQMTLRLLNRDENTRVVQAPKIIALDHQEATIFVGETIRFAQTEASSAQQGTLEFSVREADNSPVQTGFQLLIIPHVIPGEDKILMEIVPQAESLSGPDEGFDVFTVGVGSSQGQISLPRVRQSSLVTRILLESGQSAVIGGLMTDTEREVHESLPLLGDIPLLGNLFSRKQNRTDHEGLIIILTPTVLKRGDYSRQDFLEQNENRTRRKLKEYEGVMDTTSR